MSLTPGGFGLQEKGWRILVPEDRDGKINYQKVRNATRRFHNDIFFRDIEHGFRQERPWNSTGLKALSDSQAWDRMVDAKRKAVARKNALIDAAKNGDENAIRELEDMMAETNNLARLKRSFRLPKRARPNAYAGMQPT